MEIELVEIRDFLAQRPPFDALPEEALNQLPKTLDIRYLRRESAFPPADTDDSFIYLVRSGAIELRGKNGKLIEKLGEGDIYPVPCQLVDLEQGHNGTAVEDTLLYLLPCNKLGELRKTSATFDQHFSESMRERLKRAVGGTRATSSNNAAHMSVEVHELLKKPAVFINVNCSIQQAAQRMTENNVSSVMIRDGDKLAGIITDRDLRKRCIAEGLSSDQPARLIMSTSLESIPHNALMIHALLLMTRLHVHHLPVLKDGKIFGMLTASDLARQQNTNSAFIATDIRKSNTIEDLARACKRLPDLQLHLSNASASALHIGESVSCITDSVTRRLIEMAEVKLGAPPVPYVWVAGGSQARREQTSHSDQDNALIISNKLKPEHDTYFAALANFVTDGLNACGYVYCPGKAMASNPKWRQPLRVWCEYFNGWIDKPDPMALMLSSIFFDLGPVYGDDNLFEALQGSILAKTKNNGIFIAYMASNALQHRPPLGFFRTFVLIHDGKHDDTFDIKHRGIVPITDIARVLALAEGLPATNTTDRLRAAMQTPSLSEEMGENLEDALEFIAILRMNHQAEQIRNGVPPDNYLPPNSLSELERTHLKDAFKVIQSMQETLESRYQLGRFG
ncbi:MAG: cyclic nucleotide-binding protein [Gammaproteobacteria bacterium (ex Lamellibrachia satsuma)]|nr:MAG: cyclic nucleotide-binding/CBS domain-containing protein [Gammaproteobacteria bacterium (ex Lamellibrachia satsuma)]RRS34560.1 MAG: cyclic nucleotide-binding protein [Gammaproteobacteria bacterium (ex Lamellibrachia satsuma)]RRS37449.1 MAG: cyclic nucleotide-binding protein [Gammaproteobacteria bacterium (ex Lamellibrachia satsuma)]